MSLQQIQIHNLRNIQYSSLALHPHLNFIIGNNGSGKTSFLEAIYLLSRGFSFRTRDILPLIREGEDSFFISGETIDQQQITIKKSLTSLTQVKLNSTLCKNNSELAYFLPCQIFYQDIFQIIDAGATIRRNVLDWGLFYWQPIYLSLWKKYCQALKQRNSLLKQRPSLENLLPWSKILCDLGIQLDKLRYDYTNKLCDEFNQILTKVSSLQCTLTYYNGWDKIEKDLHQAFINSYHKDLSRQFTHYGPHQADLIIKNKQLNAKHYFSRGEQKIILFSLKIAQANLLKRHCAFLCDDLPAEFDSLYLERLLTLCNNTAGQFFITLIEPLHVQKIIKNFPHKIFTIANGYIQENE